MGFATLIAYSSPCSIEVEAARQYASSWWSALSHSHAEAPSALGWILQVALLFAFSLLNCVSEWVREHFHELLVANCIWLGKKRDTVQDLW
ncbi:hypothetical protein NZD89_22350 [Alicyclobacillus fastidiosus]|uniref:Uncharacterized protein n=1 Tax=Alicyclobacillus fastidiosus TaxID=392011 RepID=A0ABY6ZFW4_9BACL|nr:hypothetical protein [Alicyclobacillus fastidiosus]WAH41000.1 hypothetical protein NZD89_22350 [Alicyclobacillus fastidiosus]